MKNYNLVFSVFRSPALLAVFVLIFLNACNTNPQTSSSSRQSKNNSKNTTGVNLQQLSGKNRVEFEFHFFNANKEKILGNFEIAEKLFLKALHVNPNSAATMYELANIYSYYKNKRSALLYSHKAALLDPENVWYRLLYIDCLNEAKQYDILIEEYEQLIKEHPNRIDYYYELANVYLSLNKASDAIRMYDEIEKIKGVTDEISMQKLRIFRATKNYDASLKEIKKLIEKFPKDGKNYAVLGEQYKNNGENEKALEAYKKVLKLSPEDPYAHLTMADFYRSQKQKDKAFAEIKIAFHSSELDIDTKVKMLLSYYSITEEFEELKSDAYELCDILVDVHPKEAKAYSIAGDFNYRDKKLEEAKILYKKAIAFDKGKYAIWNQLLIIESELGNFELLREDSKEAMELFPNQALPYYFNGSSNIQLGSLKKAIVSLNMGKDLVFDNELFKSQFYASIGDAYHKLKNYTASDAAYEKALESDSENSYVLNNYAYYLSLRKENLEKAKAMSSKSNELMPNSNSFQDTYGWILYQMENYEDAKKWIAKAIANDGSDNGTLLEHYGDILYKLNELNEAVSYWQNAKKLGGTSEFIDKKIEDKKLYE